MISTPADVPTAQALDDAMAAVRAREFAMLDEQGLTYLDFTGAALPSASQILAHDALLRGSILGNPHSEHAPSRAASVRIRGARERVLNFLDADPAEYDVCFVANTSAACKLVAESFPFGANSSLVLTADNHNSVNGTREFARRAGARLLTIPLTSTLEFDQPNAWLERGVARGPSLFAFPAQSNFSGGRHPLSLVADAQKLGYAVLLDAAAYVPTSRLDLRSVRPDFVTISFYKLFGIPTGIGALVARRGALAQLRRPWFAGGTVDWVSVQHEAHQLRPSIDAFEDGTPNYYGIAALESGFDLLEGIGMDRVNAHVARLTTVLLAELGRQVHDGGAPVFRVYGKTTTEGRGGSVALNLLDRAGKIIAYEPVESRARDERVAVRSGCFCNPGASEASFDFPAAAARDCFGTASVGGFTPRKFGDCIGGEYAAGAVRLSVGVPTTASEVERAVRALAAMAREG